MGMMVSPACNDCGHRWTGEMIGGTWNSGVYRCDLCGQCGFVTVDDLESGGHRSDGPWGLTRAEVVRILGSCSCGGAFDADAPIRCPLCKSTDVDPYGNPDGATLMVD